MFFLKKNNSVFAELHIVVLILGFSAILGKLIKQDAMSLVFFRTLIGVLSLVIWALITKRKNFLTRKTLIAGAGIGILLAAHWLTFFHAIKISNVSVTLGCLGTSTLFAAFFEPIIDRKKLSIIDIVAGLIIIVGIYLIFRFEFRYVEGIIFAVVSAVLAAMFSVFNKHLAKNHQIQELALSELFVACVVTFFVMLFSGENPLNAAGSLTVSDSIYLIILGTIGTAYAYTATIGLISKLNAYSVILTINLEPVYGIILAWWIFGESERMTGGFYIGAGVVLLTVVLYSLMKSKRLIGNNKIDV